MTWLDAILGRPKLPRANLERFFTLATARVTLETGLNLAPTGRAGICFKPVISSGYRSAEESLSGLINLACVEFRSKCEFTGDRYGYIWCIFEDPQFEDLVSLAHLAGKTLEEEGFSEQLLSAVFGFKERNRVNVRPEKTAYLIYNYKRGAFYPFVPGGNGDKRDNPLEIRISSLMEKELPVEKDLSQWYPVWDCPV
jgi:hypothetical protein